MGALLSQHGAAHVGLGDVMGLLVGAYTLVGSESNEMETPSKSPFSWEDECELKVLNPVAVVFVVCVSCCTL